MTVNRALTHTPQTYIDFLDSKVYIYIYIYIYNIYICIYIFMYIYIFLFTTQVSGYIIQTFIPRSNRGAPRDSSAAIAGDASHV